MPPNSNMDFSFNFFSISLRKWFNNQYLPHRSSKSSQTKLLHPYSLRVLRRYQECDMKHCGLGKLPITNKTKQNKLPCFIDSFDHLDSTSDGNVEVLCLPTWLTSWTRHSMVMCSRIIIFGFGYIWSIN
jgi:hypothetical protein